MKTAILMTNKLLHHYDLKKLKPCAEQFILITSPEYYDKLPQETSAFFDKVLLTPTNDKKSAVDKPLQFEIIKQKFSTEVLPYINTENSRIICNDEANMAIAAAIRDSFAIPGLSPTQIQRYRNKLTMKEILREAGIRVPKFQKISIPGDTKAYFDHLAKEFGLPFIVKPIDGMGTIGVELIHNAQELESFFNTKYHDNVCYEAEEYIDGQLYHCDTVTANNKALFCAVSKYMRAGLSFSEGLSRGSAPLTDSDPITCCVKDFASKVISTLGNFNGVTHLEVFLTKNDELVFLEIGARTPGSLVLPIYKKCFNANLLELDFYLQMGEPTPSHHDKINHAFWCRFPQRLGKVKKLNPPTLKSPHSIKWNINEGDEMSNASSIISSAAADIIVENQNFDILMEDFEYLKHHVLFDLV